MYKSLVKYIMDLFAMYSPVSTVKYQGRLLNNAQNNCKNVQVYLENSTYSRLNITTNVFITTFNIWCLATPSKHKDAVLNIQDLCFSICNNVINRFSYQGADIYDYSIVTVDGVTDDNSAGCRLTLDLQVALSDLCNEDNWREEPISQDEVDSKINIKEKIDKDITINPIKLERIPKC